MVDLTARLHDLMVVCASFVDGGDDCARLSQGSLTICRNLDYVIAAMTRQEVLLGGVLQLLHVSEQRLGLLASARRPAIAH